MKRFALLGATRGLGREVSLLLREEGHSQQLILARKSEPSFDFSKPEQWPEIISCLRQWQPDYLWYFAGGGPHGRFEKKDWKDHLWALNVSFLFPAYLIHEFCRKADSVQQLIVVGSAIAEQDPDPLAASYAAAKHGLRGLVTTLQAEQPRVDLRLFSPGYLKTDLLPASAEPRQKQRAVDPRVCGKVFIEWALNGHGNWSDRSAEQMLRLGSEPKTC